MASLDHAMWFHREVKIDDWLLYAMDSPNASGSRGLARGQIFARDGTLVASTAQEGLVRVLSAEGAAKRRSDPRQQNESVGVKPVSDQFLAVQQANLVERDREHVIDQAFSHLNGSKIILEPPADACDFRIAGGRVISAASPIKLARSMDADARRQVRVSIDIEFQFLLAGCREEYDAGAEANGLMVFCNPCDDRACIEYLALAYQPRHRYCCIGITAAGIENQGVDTKFQGRRAIDNKREQGGTFTIDDASNPHADKTTFSIVACRRRRDEVIRGDVPVAMRAGLVTRVLRLKVDRRLR